MLKIPTWWHRNNICWNHTFESQVCKSTSNQATRKGQILHVQKNLVFEFSWLQHLIITGLPVVSSVIKYLSGFFRFRWPDKMCIPQLTLIHTKMFDERMFLNGWQSFQECIINLYKWETINKLTSVQIPNGLTIYQWENT